MNKLLVVSKGNKELTLVSESLNNTDIIIKKTTKGKDFEITLHRFSLDDIAKIQEAMGYIYEKSDKTKCSIIERIEKLLK